MKSHAEDENRAETALDTYKPADNRDKAEPAAKVSASPVNVPRKQQTADIPGTSGARKRQQQSEALEAGSKRSFQNLGSSNGDSEHASPRRAFLANLSQEPAAQLDLLSAEEGIAGGRPQRDSQSAAAALNSNSTLSSAADLPLAGKFPAIHHSPSGPGRSCWITAWFSL